MLFVQGSVAPRTLHNWGSESTGNVIPIFTGKETEAERVWGGRRSAWTGEGSFCLHCLSAYEMLLSLLCVQLIPPFLTGRASPSCFLYGTHTPCPHVADICFTLLQATSHICLLSLRGCSWVDLGSVDRPKNKQLKNGPTCLFPWAWASCTGSSLP